MDTLYYDVIIHIFSHLDLQSLVNLLNCNNKYIYENLMDYIKQKKIYKDIIRYDVERYKRFEKIYYTEMRACKAAEATPTQKQLKMFYFG